MEEREESSMWTSSSETRRGGEGAGGRGGWEDTNNIASGIRGTRSRRDNFINNISHIDILFFLWVRETSTSVVLRGYEARARVCSGYEAFGLAAPVARDTSEGGMEVYLQLRCLKRTRANRLLCQPTSWPRC